MLLIYYNKLTRDCVSGNRIYKYKISILRIIKIVYFILLRRERKQLQVNAAYKAKLIVNGVSDLLLLLLTRKGKKKREERHRRTDRSWQSAEPQGLNGS